MSYTINQLLVNGARTDYAQILMTMVYPGPLGGIPYTGPIIGATAINYDGETDGQLVHGTAQTPLGQTVGQYSCSASITFLKPEYEAFINFLALQGNFLPTSGWMTKFFTINLSYTLAPDAPLINDTLYGCRVKKDSEAHKTGGEALSVTVDIQPLIIVKNGIMPTNDSWGIGAALTGLPNLGGAPFSF